MDKCHYVYDKKAGKVLIPGCWSVAISGDMERCTCRLGTSEKKFETREFNRLLKEKNEYIKNLEKENARLIRILRKVNGFK